MNEAVWFAIPAITPELCSLHLPLWRARGYRTAIYVKHDTAGKLNADNPFAALPRSSLDLLVVGEYRGYADAVNRLCRTVISRDLGCCAVVTGGEDDRPGDQEPSAAVRLHEFRQRFPDLYGVMQPNGDVYDRYHDGVIRSAQYPCCSPWLGRRYCQEANQGNGPLWGEYWHCYCDLELHAVATRDSVLWLRDDAVHYHDHWTRRGIEMPCHIQQVCSVLSQDEAIYLRRKADGFPGSERKRCK